MLVWRIKLMLPSFPKDIKLTLGLERDRQTETERKRRKGVGKRGREGGKDGGREGGRMERNVCIHKYLLWKGHLPLSFLLL